ncbi:MAG: hypothetical protein WBY94_00840 [Polyangiaceae bacterium]
MRLALALACCGAAAIAGAGIANCSDANSTAPPAVAPPAASGVEESQGAEPPPTSREQAQDLVSAAEIQIRDLEGIRAASTDLSTSESLDRQVVAVSRYRDAVLADLGDPQSPRLGTDASNLRRAMESAAAAQPQAPDLPPIQRQDRPPGGDIALPPER